MAYNPKDQLGASERNRKALEEEKKIQREINDLKSDYVSMLQDTAKIQSESTVRENAILSIDAEIYAAARRRLELSDKLNKLDTEKLGLDKEAVDILKRQINLEQKSIDNREVILKITKTHYTEIEKVKELQEKYNEELGKAKDTAGELAKPFTSITKSLKGLLGPLGGMFGDVFDKIDADVVKNIQEKMVGNLSDTKQQLDDATANLNDELKNAGVDAKDLGINLSDVSQQATNAANSTGTIGTNVAQVGKGTGVLGKLSGGFKQLGTIGKSVFSGLISGARALAATLLANPIFLAAAAIGAVVAGVAMLVDSTLEVDKHTTDIAKNLNISKDSARELLMSMDEQGILFENVVKYSGQLRDNFGQAGAVLAKDVIPRMQSLQFNMQLSDENMSNLVSSATLLGSSFAGTSEKASEFETAVINATKAFYEQQGIQITSADLMNDVRENMQIISGISKKSLAIYGKSAEQLTKQVQSARKLGLEFEQTVKISESVLNIENSIQKEMEANVILGKRFNFNQIRAAALFGDQAQVAAEVTKQFEQQNINLDSFNNMMPLRKKALSDAIGLGEEEIQQMLIRKKLEDSLTGKYKNNSALLFKQYKLGEITRKQLLEKLKNEGKLTEEQANQLITAERKTEMQQDLQMVQDQLGQTLKANMSGLQSFIKVLADFGSEVSSAGGFANYLLGMGKTQAEVQAEEAVKNKTEISADLAKQATEDADTGKGTYAAYTAAGAAIGLPFGGGGAPIGAGIGFTAAALQDMFADKEYEQGISKGQARSTTISGTGLGIAAQPPSSTPAKKNDFIMRPGQDPISFNKDDIIIGGTSLLSGGESDNSEMVEVLKKQNELLQAILASTSGPTLIQIGDRTIEEIGSKTGMRRNFTTTGIGNTYGKTLPGY